MIYLFQHALLMLQKKRKGKRCQDAKEGKTSQSQILHSLTQIHITLPMWVYHKKLIFQAIIASQILARLYSRFPSEYHDLLLNIQSTVLQSI